jgi:hypothetical protein
MKIRLAVITILLSGLFSCGGSKKVQQEQFRPKPEWIKSRPSSQAYYYGIGASRKTLDANQYMQSARQNALADMAGEISVSISSNSVLHAFESNLNFREDFTSTIRTQAQQDLEGYEMVDSWEDAENYWVFYKLSKAQHQEIKEKRRANAITQSLNFYSNALNSRNQGDIRSSIVQLIKALNPIKPYFSEPLPANYKGKQIYLGSEILNELTHTLNQIKIVPVNKSIMVKLGNEILPSQLQFMVKGSSTNPAHGIPLLASYTEKPIRNNKQRTNANGVAGFSVDIVRSKSSIETFSATLDMDDFLAEANADPLIRKLVKPFNLPNASININIRTINFAVVVKETVLGKAQIPPMLKESFERKSSEAGFKVTPNQQNADYIATIIAVANPRTETGQYKNVQVEGSIKVQTNQGDVIYLKALDGFNGRHFNYEQAANEAFREVIRKFENSYFREIQEAIAKR